ncbi:MAG: HDIG domain-containing metalloprotein [Atribacterota bacterium]
MKDLKKIVKSRLAFFSFRTLNFPLYGIALFFIFWFFYTPQEFRIQEGEVANFDIVASKTIEIVDAEKTEELKRQVLSSLAPEYRVDESINESLKKEVNEFFVAIEEFRSGTLLVSPQAQDVFCGKWKITRGTFEQLVYAREEEYQEVKNTFLGLLVRYLFQPIRQEGLGETILEMNAELDAMHLSAEASRVVSFLLYRFLRPNAIVDSEATQKKRLEALQSVKPVLRTIPRGTVIVSRGRMVTASEVKTLEILGLLRSEHFWVRLLTLVLLIGGCLSVEYYYLKRFDPTFLERNAFLLLRIVVVAGTLTLNSALFRFSDRLVILSAIPLVLFALLGRSFTLGESLVIFPLFVWGMRADFFQVVYLYFNLLLPIFILGKSLKRKDLVQVGFEVALVNLVLNVFFSLQSGATSVDTMGNALYGFGGGILGAIVALGGISFFESTLRFTSDIHLVEFLNPTYPLLQRLLMEAPGTYSHSLMVANLAEAASEEIGANPLLVRVGAYYHDIGKLKRPYFFVENQLPGNNVHDRLSPTLSALVIQKHVKDGLDLAIQYRLPLEVREIIRRHHGKSLIRYFYNKALGRGEKTVEEVEFRYGGPLPHTKEEVLVFLADSIEAAVRCIDNPSPKRIETMVNGIIDTYLRDGQLNESSLTLQDLHRVAQKFTVLINGLFHTRIAYPEIEETKNGRKKDVTHRIDR